MPKSTTRKQREPSVPAGLTANQGELGVLIQQFDWSSTRLGPRELWPPALQTAVNICIASRFPMAVLWQKPHYTFLYNDAYIPVLGHKHPAALGLQGAEVWPELWEVVGPMMDSVIDTGQATWQENFLFIFNRQLPREEVYFTFSYSPIVSGSTIDGVLCTCFETTERVVGERRLRTLGEVGAEANAAQDPDEACERMMAVIGRNPGDVPAAALYMKQARGEYARISQCGFDDAGGSRLPVRLSHADYIDELERTRCCVWVQPLPAELDALPGGLWPEPSTAAVVLPIELAGQPDLAGFILCAISPRRVFDDGYQSFLEILARQFSTALSNARAYQQERRRAEALAEVDRAKTVFFSNVSHEFRTPLTLLLGPLEDMLSRGEQLTVRRDELEPVYRNALRLLKLVNALLDFSRLEAGRMQAQYRPVDLAGLTADLASNFRAAIERAGIRYEVRCEPLSHPLYVDRDMWEKIVLNLLSNAFKYTFEGSISVWLGERDGVPTLEVTDTGIGIPSSGLPHIFERFYRVAGARGRSAEGSGIGLALSAELVKLHGGSIGVTSEEGRGSIFTVRLPYGAVHLPDRHVSHDAPEVATSTPSVPHEVDEAMRWIDEVETSATVGVERVLLAEDNADMRDYIAGLLRMAGYEVEAVAHGEQALAAAQRQPPAVLLTDLMMPVMDGFELVRRMRDDARFNHVPIIVLSARAGEEERIEGFDIGADDYLIKPFSARELVSRIRSVVELSRVRHELLRQSQLERDRAVHERERLYRLLEQVPSFVALLVGPRHVFEFVNDNYRRLVGYRELIGHEVREVFPEIESQGILELLDRVYLTGKTFLAEEKAIQLQNPADGLLRQYYLTFSYTAIRDAQGHVTGVLAHGFDVTHHVQARGKIEQLNAELRRSQGELEQTVERRTLQLLSANERLVRLDQVKSEFLASMSHELRTPLNSIIGFNTLVAEAMAGPVNDEQKRQLDMALASARHLLQLIGDLLDVSRIESGKMRIDCDWIELPAMLTHLTASLEPQAESKGLQLRTDGLESLPSIYGDERKIRQIILNLLSNAIKFTDRGEVCVRGSQIGDLVRIVVEDTGIGIATQDMSLLFEPFSRLAEVSERPREGTGLGLYLSSMLAQAMGGTLRAHSEPRRGSRFTLELPLRFDERSNALEVES